MGTNYYDCRSCGNKYGGLEAYGRGFVCSCGFGLESNIVEDEEDNPVSHKPKQYKKGIDTFTRSRENMSTEGIMAATVMTVDAYIWRDKGTDYEDFKKARDWLDYCIKIIEERGEQ